MTTLERTHRIMNAIPDGHKVWPEWYWPYCGICGTDCEKDTNQEAFCRTHDAEKIVYKYDPPTEGQGEWALNSLDLADEKNLWALLRVWRHMASTINQPCFDLLFGCFLGVGSTPLQTSKRRMDDIEHLLGLEHAND